ncbi:MAG: DsbA family protein [Chloroflexi bacterium]|nr:DsbA family protein [Chloroflexota bacterium]
MSKTIRGEVYFDYGCPYVYRAAEVVHAAQAALGNDLQLTWRSFSLEQINSKREPEWKVWDQGADYSSRGLPAFRAGEAARRQGEVAFDRYRLLLLRAKHEHGADIKVWETLRDVAQQAELDLAQFQQDYDDPALLKHIAADHTHAVEDYHIFGTPTFVFEGAAPAYIKLGAVPESREKSVELFQEIYHVMAERPLIVEIKRPH